MAPGKLRGFMFALLAPLIVSQYYAPLPPTTGPEDAGLLPIVDTPSSEGSDRGGGGVATISGAGGSGDGGSRAFSYSLYGAKTRYTRGAVEAARAAASIFPTWKVHIYHDHTVPGSVLSELSNLTHVRLIDVERDMPEWVHRDLNPMSWRFLIASDPTVAVYAVRDCDSRPTARERAAVDEWLRSGRSFHIMRDHPMHNPVNFAPILGGMWGGLRGAVPNMEDLLREYYGAGRTIRYAEDQNFLWQRVMPLAANDCVQHDSYYCVESGAIAFPMTRAEAGAPHDYVGRPFHFSDVDEKPDARLSIKHYFDRYNNCLSSRRQIMLRLKANNMTIVPDTSYKGKVEGSSTESWDQWRAKMAKNAKTKPKVVVTTHETSPGKPKVTTQSYGQDATEMKAEPKVVRNTVRRELTAKVIH